MLINMGFEMPCKRCIYHNVVTYLSQTETANARMLERKFFLNVRNLFALVRNGCQCRADRPLFTAANRINAAAKATT